MEKDQNDKNPHVHHRLRMRDRFISHPESLGNHEIMELLLYYAIPQKNTNPLAHDLLDRYGNFSNVFNADPAELQKIKGVGKNVACFLSVIGKIKDIARDEEEALECYSLERVKPFLTKNLANKPFECFYAFYLDKFGRILKRELCSQHSAVMVAADFSEVHKTCLLLKPSEIVIAHNHPSGFTQPSKQDDNALFALLKMFEFLGVKLYDHLIVAGDNFYSYRESGRLKELLNLLYRR